MIHSRNTFSCKQCKYIFPLDKKPLRTRYKFTQEKKNLDAILEKNEEQSMGQTDTNCPNCGHDVAYFFQMQTRSADEASTLFFKCKKCQHTWKEG